MSFGWSPSDILSLVRLCYDIYNFCRNAPADVQTVVGRLKRIAGKLDHFANILEKSGLGTWKSISDLEEHLCYARKSLKPLVSVPSGDTSMFAKGSLLTRIALNHDKLKRLDQMLKADEQAIDDVKMDLILACALKAANLSGAPDVNEFGSRFSSLSESERSTFQLQQIPSITSTLLSSSSNRPGDMPAVSPGTTEITVAPNTAMISNFRVRDTAQIARHTSSDYQEVTDLQMKRVPLDGPSESRTDRFLSPETDKSAQRSSRGFMLNHDDPSLLEYDKLTKINLCSLSKACGSRFETSNKDDFIPLDLTPDVSEKHYGNIFRDNPVDSGAAWTSQENSRSRTHVGLDHLKPKRDQLMISSVHENDNSRHVQAVHMNPKRFIRLLCNVRISLADDETCSSDCRMQLEEHGDFVILSAVPLTSAQDTLIPASGSATRSDSDGITSTRNLGPTCMPNSAPIPLVRHCFHKGLRPIPHLLHPAIEGLLQEPKAPYTISFSGHQCVVRGHLEEAVCWTNKFRYIFHEKQDQLTVCEAIFDGQLIASLGSDRVICNGRMVSRLSSVLIWLKTHSNTLTITFRANLLKGEAGFTQVELIPHALLAIKGFRSRPNELVILAELVSRSAKYQEFGGSLKDETVAAWDGSSSDAMRNNPFPWAKDTSQMKCAIDFTQPSDKDLFKRHLEYHLASRKRS